MVRTGNGRATRQNDGSEEVTASGEGIVRWCRRQHGEKKLESRNLKHILVWSGSRGKGEV